MNYTLFSLLHAPAAGTIWACTNEGLFVINTKTNTVVRRRKVREIVDAHLNDSAFDVEQLCRAMAMSHSQLHRKLSALTGLAATKFIRHVRLSKAQDMLRDETLTVAAVAYDTGFSDPSYFGRVFRQEFGVSPQEWREGAVVKNG